MEPIKKQQFEYMLRYCMEPKLCEQERLENLLTFCRQSGTTDVMFFYNCEELNRGHYTPDELDLRLDLIARMKPILAAEGISTSINPWTTMLHTDRGRTLRPGQDFTLMMDARGKQAAAVACPSDEHFLQYLAWQYRSCAEKVHPRVLWVEDDFRLHNHHPLDWGGCFCDKHMAMFSELAGKKLNREAFIAGILEPGPVHPYRKIWLDTAQRTMLGVARTIRDAVMAVSPEIRLGLMTSDPAAHCIEGRDWQAIFTAFRTGKDPYIRIHLPSYQECTSQSYGVGFARVSRQVRHLAPDWADNYGELENFTFSRMSTSQRFTQMQIETNTLLDSKGITMDIYDMLGNGVLPSEGYQDILAESKPFLDTLVSLGLDNRCQAGVQVMIDPRCGYHLHTAAGRSMNELTNHERNLIDLLTPFGIAACYNSGHHPSGQVVAAAGQYLRNLAADEIRRLFADNYVILDGEAVSTLVDLGLGELAGAAGTQLIPMDNGINAYEQVVDGAAYCGITKARLTMQSGAGDFVKVDYFPETALKAYTHACSPYGDDNGPAMTVVNGQVFILPYINYGVAALNPYRRAILLDALTKADRFRRPVWTNAPHTTVIRYDQPGRTLLALVNFSGDEWRQVVLTFPDGIPAWQQATLYTRENPDGIPAPLTCCGSELQIGQDLPRINMMIVELTYPGK